MTKEMKTCTKCREAKGLEFFGRHSRNRDGLQSQCNGCSYYQRHKDAVLSSCKRYRRDNPDMAIKWRQANKEQKAEYARRYRRDNLEALSESGKDYNKKNRDLRNALKARRKAYKLKATPEWLTEEQDNKIKMYYKIAKALEKMDGVKRHVDHIVPLKGKGVRGLHVPWNLQILTAEANLSKNNSYSNWD